MTIGTASVFRIVGQTLAVLALAFTSLFFLGGGLGLLVNAIWNPFGFGLEPRQLIVAIPFLGFGFWLGTFSHRLGQSCVGLRVTLGFGAVVHAAAVLGTWFASNNFRFLLPFHAWALLSLGWLMWPIVLFMHSKRVVTKIAIPIAISLLLLAPCIPRLISFAPSALGIWVMPTKDSPTIERSENLGFGFSAVVLAEKNEFPNAFESVGHFGHLFYRGQDLGHVNDSLASPSGKAIVYQEATSGKIFVFYRDDRKTVELTKEFPGLVNRFVWHEAEGDIDAFVVPNSAALESAGKWIKLQVNPRT
jgi:hypothetical protein